jgi:uncharacterized protein YigE (DUF2233 family)
MKKIVLLVGIICILFSLSYFGNKLRSFYIDNKSAIDPIVNLQAPTKSTKDIVEIPYQGKTLLISWISVEDSNKIFLYSNLQNQQDARTIAKERECKVLTSGGFYSKENKHIGLFVTEGNEIERLQVNRLFNGILSIDKGAVYIRRADANTTAEALLPPRVALQTGPVLIENEKIQKIENAAIAGERRIVVAITPEGKTVFLALYQKDSAYLGPKLSDLPQVLIEFQNKTGITFIHALNLDGGTASAFLTDSVTLGELTPIGSYFCIKN